MDVAEYGLIRLSLIVTYTLFLIHLTPIRVLFKILYFVLQV